MSSLAVDMSTDYEYHPAATLERWPSPVFLSEEHGAVVGVNGCPAGWMCFRVDLQSRSTRIQVYPSLAELIKERSRPRLVAIDIPIGLADRGSRACDLAARRLLGRSRSSSVFPAPVRATLAAKSYEEACDLSRKAHGVALSRQSFGLLAKIREVDEVMTPELQSWIFEVHPEVSFWALNGRQPLKHSKATSEGRQERLKLLLPRYPDIEGHLAGLHEAKAAEHDLLDAAAAAWTAECVARGKVPRQYDSRGLRMEIVY